MQNFQDLLNKALRLHKENEIKKALKIYLEILNVQKNNSKLLYLIGTAYIQINKFEQAIKFLNKSISIDENNLATLNNLGGALQELNKFEDAIKIYNKLFQLDPNHLQAKNNIANCFTKIKKFNEAVKIYKELIKKNPYDYVAYNNLGNVNQEMNHDENAIYNYTKSINLKSDYFIAHKNLGDIYKKKGRYKESLNLYNLVNKLKPGYKDIISNIIETKMLICEWGDYESYIKKIRDIIKSKNFFNPFTLLYLIDDPYLQKKTSKIYIKERYSDLNKVISDKKNKKKLKPKIGYFSADFGDHATLHLIFDIFKHHDKSKFDFYAFSFGSKKDDSWNTEVRKYFKDFIDVDNMSDEEIAITSQKIGIDIAVDLKGFTQDARPGIFLHRAAPIQINYLGYPGTMGSDFIDYILADKIVIPKKNQKNFTEKVIYLKNCYQPNMDKRDISIKKFTKSDFELPEDAFVFCSFNSNYKITPYIFNIWMNILKKVPNSILWILVSNSDAKKNLKLEAKQSGVNENRIIFAKKIPVNEHLKRMQIADLFLDTFPCNAHTTASEAIRMALPIITISGESFASRVAKSILNQVNLNGLVVNNEKDYQNLAIDLANNKSKLEEIKSNLRKSLKNTSLYNSKEFTKNLEDIYTEMINK